MVLRAFLLVVAVFVSSAQAADWPMYGHDTSNSRFNAAETAIGAQNVAGLHEVWFLPTAAPVTATPAVVGGVVYVGSWDHNFYALDALSGKVLWKISLLTPQGDQEGPFPGIQSSALVLGKKVYFGDSCGYLHGYAANGSGAPPHAPSAMTIRNRGCASNGTEVPGFPVDLAGALPNSQDAVHTDIFSSPVPFTPTLGPNKGRKMLYIGAASHVDNPCIHGALFALDANSGQIVWRFDVVPSSAIGGGVWSTPTIDSVNSLVYTDTGDCVNNASSGFSESILALDASCSGVAVDKSCPALPAVTYPPNPATAGNPVWFFQAHPNGDLADLDFGSSPNLITNSAGQPALVGAGSKDGIYYAVNAGRGGGQLVWKSQVAVASVAGGFQGSTAFAYGKIFGTTFSGPEFLLALNAFTGSLVWDAPDGASSFSPVGVANGLVFSGDHTGTFKVHDAADGLLLFSFPTGGSVSGGPVIAEGMAFVGVGLTTSQTETHGLFAFSP
jgi:polyvinyl alcohol dehydrogenase (cytochrome)